MTKSPQSGPASATAIANVAAVIAVFMIAQQIASKAVRDGLFLSYFDVTWLPVATFGAAAISFGTALYLGKFLATFSPATAVPVLFTANGMLFGAEAVFVGAAPQLVAAALYLHVAAFGGAVVSGFWSVINERFDPYTAKRVMGRIAGGATFGGVAGGALTWIFSDAAPEWLLAGFALGSGLCALGIGSVARGARHERSVRESAPLLAGVGVLKKNAYPRAIAGIVFLGAMMTALVDYVFKAGVAAETSPEALVGFFAVFYTAVGAATFVVQALASQPALRILGVVATVGLLPIVTGALSGVAALWPALLTLVLLRGGAMVVENSMYRSGYELLYTAVPPDQKRSAKILIDLGSDRLGTAACSGLVLLAVAALGSGANRALLLASVATAFAILGVLARVRREYIQSLAGQLRNSDAPGALPADNQALRLASTFVADSDFWQHEAASTADPSADLSTHVISRDDLLRAVRTRADEKAALRATPAQIAPPRISAVNPAFLHTPLRRRLRSEAPLDEETRQSAPAVIGELGDIVLSQREPLAVRLRAIELLSGAPSPRGAATLLEALTFSRLRLRRAAAIALLKMCRIAPPLRPSRRRLAELAAKELRLPSRPPGARTPFELESPFLRDARGNILAPNLEIVFLLLAIRGDEAELRLALSAITAEDRVQRGTGLEYLDNLLPGNLRARLLSLAEHPEMTAADQGLDVEIVEKMADRLRRGLLSLSELRQEYRLAKKRAYDRT